MWNLVLRTLIRLPRAIVPVASIAAAALLGRTNQHFYHAAAENMATVLSLPADHPDIHKHVQRQIETQLLNMSDLLRLQCETAESVFANVEIDADSEQVLRQLQENGTPAVFFTCHLGAMDLILPFLLYRGFEVVGLSAPTTNERLFRSVTKLRSAGGAVFIEPSQTGLRRSVALLQNAVSIGITADRDVDGGGHLFPFFGREAPMPIGALWLASRSQVPLVGIFMLRDGSKLKVTVEMPIVVAPDLKSSEIVARHLPTIVEILQRHIRSDPGQWVMFQKVWKQPSAGSSPYS